MGQLGRIAPLPPENAEVFTMSRDILSTISSQMPTFSKGQRLIAKYILESYDKAAFMTASKLGRTVNVSESTVVRFAAELGFDGYPAMQRTLQEIIRNKLTSIQRIEVSDDRIGNHDILSMVMRSDMEKIRMTLEQVDRTAYDGAVSDIVSARRIYVLGVRSASAISTFLGFYFNLVFEDVVLVNPATASEIFEQILRIGPQDVLIGASFPRYSKRTVKAMQFARNRGAQVVAITDSAASPLASIAQRVLLAKSDMASFVDSLVAPLSLVNALIVAISRAKKQDLAQTLEALEDIWAEFEVYEKVEDQEA